MTTKHPECSNFNRQILDVQKMTVKPIDGEN